MDSAWEQRKLEASLPPAPRTERGARAIQGKVLENAADWASELQANIAQPKRIGAGCPRHPMNIIPVLAATLALRRKTQAQGTALLRVRDALLARFLIPIALMVYQALLVIAGQHDQ